MRMDEERHHGTRDLHKLPITVKKFLPISGWSNYRSRIDSHVSTDHSSAARRSRYNGEIVSESWYTGAGLPCNPH